MTLPGATSPIQVGAANGINAELQYSQTAEWNINTQRNRALFDEVAPWSGDATQISFSDFHGKSRQKQIIATSSAEVSRDVHWPEPSGPSGRNWVSNYQEMFVTDTVGWNCGAIDYALQIDSFLDGSYGTEVGITFDLDVNYRYDLISSSSSFGITPAIGVYDANGYGGWTSAGAQQIFNLGSTTSYTSGNMSYGHITIYNTFAGWGWSLANINNPFNFFAITGSPLTVVPPGVTTNVIFVGGATITVDYII
jgi:hypothetical protein